MQLKKCSTCFIKKSIKEFAKESNGKFGVRGNCKKCNSKRVSKYNKNRPGISEIRRQYNQSDKGIFNRYRNDATRRSRNYEFLLTFEQFSELINKECTYCGKENCRGVDRMDNSIGYVIDNCTSCCSKCNEMKMAKSLEEFYMQIEKIYHHRNNKMRK